jgi:hypothetical protein
MEGNVSQSSGRNIIWREGHKLEHARMDVILTRLCNSSLRCTYGCDSDSFMQQLASMHVWM